MTLNIEEKTNGCGFISCPNSSGSTQNDQIYEWSDVNWPHVKQIFDYETSSKSRVQKSKCEWIWNMNKNLYRNMYRILIGIKGDKCVNSSFKTPSIWFIWFFIKNTFFFHFHPKLRVKWSIFHLKSENRGIWAQSTTAIFFCCSQI